MINFKNDYEANVEFDNALKKSWQTLTAFVK